MNAEWLFTLSQISDEQISDKPRGSSEPQQDIKRIEWLRRRWETRHRWVREDHSKRLCPAIILFPECEVLCSEGGVAWRLDCPMFGVIRLRTALLRNLSVAIPWQRE